MSKQPCPVDGCEKQTKQGQVLCGQCWSRVPGNIRSRIFFELRTDGEASYQEAIDYIVTGGSHGNAGSFAFANLF